jgi:DNA-directed RNA polymerase subunit N (RpoN/RPB10)
LRPDLLNLEDGDSGKEHQPERSLQAAVLAELIRDARNYWRGVKMDVETAQAALDAFDDLIACGPMTRYCCRWLDIEPEQVTRQFIRHCEKR